MITIIRPGDALLEIAGRVAEEPAWAEDHFQVHAVNFAVRAECDPVLEVEKLSAHHHLHIVGPLVLRLHGDAELVRRDRTSASKRRLPHELAAKTAAGTRDLHIDVALGQTECTGDASFRIRRVLGRDDHLQMIPLDGRHQNRLRLHVEMVLAAPTEVCFDGPRCICARRSVLELQWPAHWARWRPSAKRSSRLGQFKRMRSQVRRMRRPAQSLRHLQGCGEAPRSRIPLDHHLRRLPGVRPSVCDDHPELDSNAGDVIADRKKNLLLVVAERGVDAVPAGNGPRRHEVHDAGHAQSRVGVQGDERGICACGEDQLRDERAPLDVGRISRLARGLHARGYLGHVRRDRAFGGIDAERLGPGRDGPGVRWRQSLLRALQAGRQGLPRGDAGKEGLVQERVRHARPVCRRGPYVGCRVGRNRGAEGGRRRGERGLAQPLTFDGVCDLGGHQQPLANAADDDAGLVDGRAVMGEGEEGA
mmetsp:Transcript_60555/g.169115  ORF Transcript_60555/g.169115 Transcript_60555/m.169115 type:complete len:476 (+) Transcript_60555:1526-2953(+)